MKQNACSSAELAQIPLPASQYQVCIEPPPGWGSAVRATHVLAGWICSTADLRTAPQLVTFRLTLQLPRVVP